MTSPQDPDNDGDNDNMPDDDDHTVIGGFWYGGRVFYNAAKHSATNTPHHPSMKPSEHHRDKAPKMGHHKR